MNIGIDIGTTYCTLCLKTVDGVLTIVEEGMELPSIFREHRLRKLFASPSLRIPILCDSEEIGVIKIDGIPEETGEHSQIVVHGVITPQHELHATVEIKGRSGAVVKKSQIRVDVPPIQIPDLAEFRRQFYEVKERLDHRISLTTSGEEQLKLAGHGKRLVDGIGKILAEKPPDRGRLRNAIRELDRLVNSSVNDLSPPWAKFLNNLTMCRGMLASKPDDPALKTCVPQLDRLERQGNESYTTRDRKKWAACNESLLDARNQIQSVFAPPARLGETRLLKKQEAMGVIEDLRESLEAARDDASQRPDYEDWGRPLCDEVERDISFVEMAIDAIPDELPPAIGLALIKHSLQPGIWIGWKIQGIALGIGTISSETEWRWSGQNDSEIPQASLQVLESSLCWGDGYKLEYVEAMP